MTCIKILKTKRDKQKNIFHYNYRTRKNGLEVVCHYLGGIVATFILPLLCGISIGPWPEETVTYPFMVK